MRRFSLVLSVLAFAAVIMSAAAPAGAVSFPVARQALLPGHHVRSVTAVKALRPRAGSSSGQARAPVSGCSDVLFVGARGSGQPSTQDSGFGHEVNNVLTQIEGDVGMGSQLTFQATPVSYHAYSVWKLATDQAAYFKDLGAGVKWTMNYLAQQAQSCPDQQIVLAGYSQGAMVMHRALHQLYNKPEDHSILSRVDAAVLIGDGDQVPFDNEVRDGSAWPSADGVGQLLPALSHSSSAPFDSSLGNLVLRVCKRGDIVCDYQTSLALYGIPKGISIHESYTDSKPLLQAAAQAARHLLALRYIGGTLNISGTVGTALSASATVTGGVLPVTVFAGLDGTPPPWLALGAGGGGHVTTVILSGTPPDAGSWTFNVIVQDSSGSEVSVPVNLTVNNVLRSFTPNPSGNGRAMAFDPATGHLFYTLEGDTNIYVADTSGNAVSALNTNVNFGALAWDATDGQLWGGAYDGTGNVYTIDPVTGATTLQFTFNFPAGDDCDGSYSGYIDGLAYDASDGTLWLSDDGGTILFHVDTSGNVLGSWTVPNSKCNQGIAVANGVVWLAYMGPGFDTPPYGFMAVSAADPTTVLADVPYSGADAAEGIAFDATTFAPTCALWSDEAGSSLIAATALPSCTAAGLAETPAAQRFSGLKRSAIIPSHKNRLGSSPAAARRAHPSARHYNSQH
jgi:Cutinase